MQKSLAQLLGALLNSKAFTVCPSEKKSINLQEQNEKKEVLQEHEILGLLPGAFSVKINKDQNWAFAQNPYGKICDYLIFIPKNGSLTVVFCELKSGKFGKRDAARQIVATIPLFHYLLSSIDTHLGKKWKVINERYAIIGKRPDIERADIVRESGKVEKPRTKEAPRDSIYYSKNEHNPDDKIRIHFILGAKRKIPVEAIT